MFCFREIDKLSGEGTVKLVCLPSEKGSTLKRKNLLPLGSKFFPFRVDLFSERVWCAGKQTESHKSYLSC